MTSSCREKKEQSAAEKATEASIEQKAEKDALNAVWVELLNRQPDSLFQAYTQEAVGIDRLGNVFAGNMAIVKDHKLEGLQIDSLESMGRLSAHRDSTIQYEVAQLWTSDGQFFKSLVIWNRSGGEPLRELELIAIADESKSFPTAIDARREDWMKLCNAHNASELVKDLYTANSIYYNHKPVVIGHEDIASEYSYMNRENYSLKLTPLIREAVDEDLAFEIGQCSGSYGGKYVLIWQKGQDDVWRILMDSNL
ncbi:MAG: hypothetical protein AAF361_00280 [Bacteroidota bacterium]